MLNALKRIYPFPYKKDKLSNKNSKPSNLCNEIEGVSWPKNLPKNFKHKDKYYIHYAAEHQNNEMLDKAINGKHDLSVMDNMGRNAIYYLFAEKKDFLNEPNCKLVDPDFFFKIVNFNKKSWNGAKNTFDLFDYFKRQTASITKHKENLVYDENKLAQIHDSYKKIIQIIKQLNLKLELPPKQFNKLRFNLTIQGHFLEDALMVSIDKRKSLTKLIEMINLFNTPKPFKLEPEKSAPFMTILDEYGYYFNDGNAYHHVIYSPTSMGMGRMFRLQENNKLIINENACQDTLCEMLEKHVLNNVELKRYFNQDDELFNLLQKYNKILYSKILTNQLNADLQEKRITHKRVKI